MNGACADAISPTCWVQCDRRAMLGISPPRFGSGWPACAQVSPARPALGALGLAPPQRTKRGRTQRAREAEGALGGRRGTAARARPASLSSPLSPIAYSRPGPGHGERAIRGEALPQLPTTSPGASLDRGFSGRGVRARAGTTSRPRVSPPSPVIPQASSPLLV